MVAALLVFGVGLDGIYSYECDSVEGVVNYLRCVFQDRFQKDFIFATNI